MIVYKWNTEAPHPIAVECDKPGFPHFDADGEMMFDNTHFATEEEAWEALVQDREAGLSLSARELRRLQAKVREITDETAEAGAQLVEVRKNYERWKRDRATRPTDGGEAR